MQLPETFWHGVDSRSYLIDKFSNNDIITDHKKLGVRLYRKLGATNRVGKNGGIVKRKDFTMGFKNLEEDASRAYTTGCLWPHLAFTGLADENISNYSIGDQRMTCELCKFISPTNSI